MTLTQLQYIVAVHEHGHFGRAAKACHVTQPTLSMQIQKLEEELNCVIFDRSKSPIRTTEKGEEFIGIAKQMLESEVKIQEIASNENEPAGNFHLGVIPTIAPYVLPLFLKKFVEQYPKVELMISELQTEEILSLLKADRLDGGLLSTPLGDEAVTEDVLYYEPFWAFLSKQHPLASKSKVREEDLPTEDVWLLEEGHCLRNQVLRACGGRSRSPRKFKNLRFQSGSLETLMNLVDTVSGYTLIPELAVGGISESRKKLLKPFSDQVPSREVALVYTRLHLKKKIRDALRTTLLDSIPSHLQKKSDSLQVLEISPPDAS